MKGLAKVLLRVLSIYFIVRSLQIVPLYISTMTMADAMATGAGTWYYIGMLAMQIIISVLIWLLADSLAGYIVGKHQDDRIDLKMKSLQIVAFSVIGVVLIVNAIPNIITNIHIIVDVYARTSGNGNLLAIVQKNISEMIGSAIKLILGIWLMLGSNGIVNCINKLKNAGLNDDEHDHLQIRDENQES